MLPLRVPVMTVDRLVIMIYFPVLAFFHRVFETGDMMVIFGIFFANPDSTP